MTNRVVAVAASVFVVVVTVATAWFVMSTPGTILSDDVGTVPAIATDGAPVIVTVKQGESPQSIGAELERVGVIRSKRLFEIMVGLRGVQNRLEAGDYEFDPGTPVVEVVERIATGKTASRDVVIPEGRRIEEVGEILEQAGIVTKDAFLAALVKSEYTEPFLQQVSASSLEGFVFPARYEFRRGASASEVVDTLLLGFQTNIADKVQLEGQELTLEQVVTLASIVEREAQTPSERPIIASVFLNRLKAGIPLQADPTVQYAVANGDEASVQAYTYWKKELTVDDLKLDSPYNTYVYAGLPPGPIANPGLASIQAVVRPAATDYLFFVAEGDGSHLFAETLEEHLRNVERYRQQQQ
jgi:UPF0755 protein